MSPHSDGEGGKLSSHQVGGDRKTSKNKKMLIGQILLSVRDSTGGINYVPLVNPIRLKMGARLS